MIPRFVRQTNKYLLNPLILRLAGHKPFAIIEHIGRKTGRKYRTPVIAMPLQNGFILALTYGENVDWYKNVLVAKGCILEQRGKRFQIDTLRRIGKQSALRVFPKPAQLLLQILKIKHFLEMDYSNVPVLTSPSRV